MRTHIVRVNDRIDKIALIYNLSKEELIKNNTHINDWNHLIPGTKIKLPNIPEVVERQLDNTEPFIEEYYPKIETKKVLDTNVEIGKEEIQISLKPKKTTNYQNLPYYHSYPYYGYYGYGYGPYSMNQFQRKRKRKK